MAAITDYETAQTDKANATEVADIALAFVQRFVKP